MEYAMMLGRPLLANEDRVRFLVDRDGPRLGIKICPRDQSAMEGLHVVYTSRAPAPRLNNRNIRKLLEEELGGSWWDVDLALTNVNGDGSVDFGFERFDVVKPRIQSLFDSIPEIMASQGFRQTESKCFCGEDHTIIFNEGRLTALKAGREVQSLHVCVPYITSEQINRFLTGLAKAA